MSASEDDCYLQLVRTAKCASNRSCVAHYLAFFGESEAVVCPGPPRAISRGDKGVPSSKRGSDAQNLGPGPRALDAFVEEA